MVQYYSSHLLLLTKCYLIYCLDMSSTAFIEPLPVVEFVSQVLGRDISSRPLSDADRVKV